MSGVLRPVGGQDSKTYWTRRVMVAVVAILAVVLVWALLSGLGGDKNNASGAADNSPTPVTDLDASPTPTPTPTPTSGVTPTPTPASAMPSVSGTPSTPVKSSLVFSATPTPTGVATPPNATAPTTPTGTPGQTPASTAVTVTTVVPPSASLTVGKPTTPTRQSARVAPCSAQDITVDLVPGARTTTTGKGMYFRLFVKTKSEGCMLTIGPKNASVRITSGKDSIANTIGCPAMVRPDSAWVTKDKPWSQVGHWNGHRSGTTCSTKYETARPGTYHIQASHLGVQSPNRWFMIK